MDDRQVLESWKEISTFLGREIRTCQRWERELGLPVYRLDGTPRARVYAYADELTDWLEHKLHKQESVWKLPSTRRRIFGLAAVLSCVAAAFLVWRFVVEPPKPPPLPPGYVQPVLAVLTFENRSGDMLLDYWRSALAELLVADLSQSRYIRVVSCDQMLTVLRRLGLAEAAEFSSEDIARIAAQTHAAHVLRGSFVKAGTSIAITSSLRETASGRSPGVLKLVAQDENDVFPQVDKLARLIKKELSLTRAQIRYDFAKETGQAVTSSSEALKFYVEGRRHQLSNRWDQAVVSMEKAIEIDPEFALAYRTLATAHRDLRHFAQARAFINKALEFSARLPLGEREFIEGQLAFWNEDYARAIEILTALLDAHPGHLNAMTYLGYAYDKAGDVDKALECQGPVTRNRNAVLDVRTQAGYLQKKGRYEEAADLCLSFLENVEDVWSVREILAYSYSYLRKFDLAFAEAQKVYHANPRSIGVMADVRVNQDDLDGAEALRGPEWFYLNRGRFAANVDYARRGLEGALARGTIDDQAEYNRRLAIALEKAGRYAEASSACREYLRLSAASREAAGESAGRDLPSLRKQDLFIKGRLEAETGSAAEALKTADELKSLVESGMNQKELKYHEYILGLVELGNGDPRRAAGFFEAACGRLEPEDLWSTEQAAFLYQYARALQGSGDLDAARRIYERITLLTTGRSKDGDLYARAYYWLGKIAEEQGETEAARDLYRKFLALWKSADPGLGEVSDAARSLSRL